LLHLAMPPRRTDGPSPIQKAAAGIGYSTIALHHHPASCLQHKHSKCAYPLFFGQTRGWQRITSLRASIPRLPPVDLDIDGKGALDSFAARLVFTAGPDIGVDGHVMLARRGGERR
jgi:hypothetical protein